MDGMTLDSANQHDEVVAVIDRELATLQVEHDRLAALISPVESRIATLAAARKAMLGIVAPQRPLSKNEQIVAALTRLGCPVRPCDLRDALIADGYSLTVPNEVATMLGALAKRGRVRQVSRGTYAAIGDEAAG